MDRDAKTQAVLPPALAHIPTMTFLGPMLTEFHG